jgi:aspartate 1-decarboxylase
MLRHFLLGKIHRCVVTRADVSYVGSVTLDPLLIEAAGFLEHEKVDIYNVTTGARFATYVIPGERGEGEVGVNGAAAHLVAVGDLLIVASYGWLNEAEIAGHRPRAVFVDERNQVVEIRNHERNPSTRKPYAVG